jgi:GNAT superfamily N-acetyltransferase
MPGIAAAEPAPVEVLERYRVAGRTWVVAPVGGPPAGYVLVDDVDDQAHVEQVSVDPAWSRRGLGRMLLDHVAAVARREGRTSVTLTTFQDVPWNAPYYARCGFRALAPDELGPGLRAVRDSEAAHGLDPETRVCMRREV